MYCSTKTNLTKQLKIIIIRERGVGSFYSLFNGDKSLYNRFYSATANLYYESKILFLCLPLDKQKDLVKQFTTSVIESIIRESRNKFGSKINEKFEQLIQMQQNETRNEDMSLLVRDIGLELQEHINLIQSNKTTLTNFNHNPIFESQTSYNSSNPVEKAIQDMNNNFEVNNDTSNTESKDNDNHNTVENKFEYNFDLMNNSNDIFNTDFLFDF